MTGETTKLTIRLPQRDVEYAKAYAKAHGINVTELIDRYMRRIRALEERPVAAELEALTGLVPADVDVAAEYSQHSVSRHSR